MRQLSVAFIALIILAASVHAVRLESEKITHDELVRGTQELFDAVANGNQGPWKQYFAEDAMYFDEKGHSLDKPALVADITPLPKGSGCCSWTRCAWTMSPQNRSLR